MCAGCVMTDVLCVCQACDDRRVTCAGCVMTDVLCVWQACNDRCVVCVASV